jgi:tetratricopeptide (TPR) repeat protein
LFWLQTGYSEKALEFFKAANTKDPLNANIWRWLSNAYDALGEYEKAVEYMDKAVRVGQGFPSSVAESLLAAGQEDRARAYLNEYSTSAEGEAAASELILNGNPEPALTQLEPDDHESRAWILQQAGRHREAMESLRLVNDGGQVTRVQIHMANNFWGPESARFRQSPEFKAFIKDFGLFDFWHEAGFPPLCRPVGKEDFECD